MALIWLTMRPFHAVIHLLCLQSQHLPACKGNAQKHVKVIAWDEGGKEYLADAGDATF